MADKKEPKLTAEEKERQAEAQGDTDMIQLTNGSGEYKKLSSEEWESQEMLLRSEGWIVMGEDSE
jgi:hypothetical protein